MNQFEQLFQSNNANTLWTSSSGFEGFWYCSINCHIAAWQNPDFLQELGYDTATPPDWLSIIEQEDLADWTHRLADCMAGNNDTFEAFIRYKHIKGNQVQVCIKGTIIKDNQEKPVQWMGTYQNVSGKNENDGMRIFVEQSPTAMAMFDNSLRYIAASPKWQTDYHLEGLELIGKSHYEIFPEIGENWKQIHQECLNGATHRKEEEAFLRQDGSVQWLKWEVKPWYDVYGTIGGIIMYTEEISVKKEAEEKLRISEETFRGSFEYAAVGMARIDVKGHWLTVNQKLCEILGYSRQELDALTFQDLTHPDDLDADLTLFQEVLDGIRDNYQMEKRYIHRSGSTVYAILAVSVVRDLYGHVLYFVSQVIDITYLKKIEQQLSEALQNNQGILDASTQVAIIGTDTKGIITTFNKGAENMLGYTASEVLYKLTPELIHVADEVITRGKHLSELYGESVEGFDVFVFHAKNGSSDTRQWTYIHKDGSHFPVLLTVTAVKRKGDIIGYLGVATDIRLLKQAEEEVKELLFFTQEQNDKLRNFAHIVAHNLRSHSSGIAILLEMLKQDYPELVNEPILTLLHTASNNLNETIKSLSEIVEINNIIKEKMHPLAVKPLVDKAIQQIGIEMFYNRITFHNHIAPHIKVMAVPAYLESIILNLVTNAVKYSSPTKESFLHIEAYQEEKYWILVFQDNGLGINLELHGRKLFGMYKTFHGNNDARGIGLFMTKNQVEAMGGKIEVESQEGVGTTFKIYLKNEEN